MKRRILSIALVLLGLCTPAFAGQNWIDRFLNRYKAAPLDFLASPVTAQDVLAGRIQNGVIPLSVADLINLTLQNNLDISVNRLSPLSSQYLIDTNYRPFEPMLRLGATVSRASSPARTQLSGAPTESQLSHSYTLGFAQTLKFGTDVSVDFTMNRSSSNNAFSTFNPSWFGFMEYSVRQRVLNGFGEDVNTRGIRIARNNRTISEVQFERQVIDLITSAQKSYWDLVFTAEDMKVKQASLELAQKTLSDNRIQVEVGTLARIDLVQAESQVATRREELIVSEHNQEQIADQVKKFLTPEPDPGLVLASLTPTQMPRRPQPGDILPVEAAIRVAFENRPELRQAAIDLDNQNIEVEYARNQLLPTLDVTANFTQSGVGGRETLRAGFGPDAPIVQVNPGGFPDALGQLFGFDFRGYGVGFNLQIPLRNRAAQADYARAATQRRIAERSIKATESQIALEVRNAITQVEMNRARIDAAQASRALAEEQLNAEQRKFELGASTVRFVLEEQRNLEQMQTNEISAIVNYAKALVDYERAIGLTLRNNNVTIEKTLAD